MMRLPLVVLVSVSMLLVGEGSRILSSGGTCMCSCCMGNFCTPTSVGTVDVSGPSECVPSLCRSSYSSCPATGESGIVSASYRSSSDHSSSDHSGASYGKRFPSTLLFTSILALPVLLHLSSILF